MLHDNESEGLNASEAVFGFAAWLLCRDEVVIFSKHLDVEKTEELCKKFCEENKLEPLSPGWLRQLKMPKE